MPPRIRLPSTRSIRPQSIQSSPYICQHCRHASLAAATTPAPTPPTPQPITNLAPPIARHPRTQPPSHKPPEFRKSQIHRQYQSLLRSNPLLVIFQHNNLKATEWMAVRRELAIALRKVDEDLAKQGNEEYIGKQTKITAVETGIFASALRVVEFWDPKFESLQKEDTPASEEAMLTHGLSHRAWRYSERKHRKTKHGLETILIGPLAILHLPTVSPQHLKAAISILAPSKEFPAPKRRENPGYHEPAVQSGVQKLMLLAARVEGKVFDMDGARWVGGIQGGMEGLRGQLVAMLAGVGAGVTSALESAGRNLWFTVEGRRGMLEEEEKKGKEGEQ
ncbi:hypothetical protein BDY17DRAFT_245559 [Neohortaea acidophila]|uniref:Uncharacterized protein n=1 Tax=Neohortaea acidophila TaxID=245834 RepID=A0A6A6Q3B2_9PEZI|nr:uncharacterized protein BDY17DRAFT_245559 [Neohortaea acidophila]KAF2486890.1 hypothetical protein BDY17DRAFT_245559 [Neohortaea acidophila]